MKGIDRERLLRTLTFWLRPSFLLRVTNAFQRIAGFDRGIALASSALTALIPLSLILGNVIVRLGGRDTADRIIDRYDLTGGGAEAVRSIFSPASATDTSLGVAGFLFLLLAVLSFTRGVQRLFEQTWGLPPLSVRNTLNGLRWIGGLVLYLGIGGTIHAVLGHGALELAASLAVAPAAFVFFVWSGWILTAKRVPWRSLLPFGVIAALVSIVY